MGVTLGGVIALVDEIKPNSFSEQAKTAWISECEGLVQTEVWLLAVEEVISYEWDRDENTSLLVEAPHSKIYEAYLTARIDFANGEYRKYQNTMQMFNAWFAEYECWYANRYRPADRHAEPWKGYYYSAYGIAVKHGFQGSEQEWLDSKNVVLRYDSQLQQLQWRLVQDSQWQTLMQIDELQGQVVAQTLTQAEGAANAAAQSAAEAQRSEANARNYATTAANVVQTELHNAKESGVFDGEDGIPATHSWNGTVLTVTSASGTSSADLKGETGAVGPQGIQGETGPRGEAGVYVLTEGQTLADAPEDADVVIDPNGEADTPVKFPNPYALTFTGAVNATYDGSEAVEVEIPSGGDGPDGDYIPTPSTANVGQTIVVKAVDENGKPTEWETADFPSGGGSREWETLLDIEISEATQYVTSESFPDGGNLANIRKMYVYGENVRDADGNGGGEVCIKTHTGAIGASNKLCGNQTTAGTMKFRAFFERVGNVLISTDIMSSHSNTYQPFVYKTAYTASTGASIELSETSIIVFGTATGTMCFGPGSKLQVLAVRDK